MKALYAHASPQASQGGSRRLGVKSKVGLWSAWIVTDEWPVDADTVHQVKELTVGTVYLAIKDGAARGFYENPRDRSGFGGNSYRINVMGKSGVETRTLKGPWSSSASSMTSVFGTPLIDVSHQRPGDRIFYASWVTVEWFVDQVLPLLGDGWEMAGHARVDPWTSLALDDIQSAAIGDTHRIGLRLRPEARADCQACDGYGWQWNPAKTCQAFDHDRTGEECWCEGTGWSKQTCKACDGKGIDFDRIAGAQPLGYRGANMAFTAPEK